MNFIKALLSSSLFASLYSVQKRSLLLSFFERAITGESVETFRIRNRSKVSSSLGGRISCKEVPMLAEGAGEVQSVEPRTGRTKGPRIDKEAIRLIKSARF